MQDLFGTDAREFHDRVLKRLGQEQCGVFILLRDQLAGAPAPVRSESHHEGHNSAEKRLQAWREVGLGAQILKNLNISSIRLLATQERNYVGLSGFGIGIVKTEIL